MGSCLKDRCGHQRATDFDMSCNVGPPTTQSTAESLNLFCLIMRRDGFLNVGYELRIWDEVFELRLH
jgi:hypothetical protein